MNFLLRTKRMSSSSSSSLLRRCCRKSAITRTLSSSSSWCKTEHNVFTKKESSVRYRSATAAVVEEEEIYEKVTSPTMTWEEDAWKNNLGRNDDQKWLLGPREDSWYTGMKPTDCPGFDKASNVLRSLPLPNLNAVTRSQAREYFDNSWTLYELLFAGMNGEEYFYRPPVHGLRHPQIFYYGHTPCLYVNKLRLSGVLQGPVNAYFESNFEVGVDEMVWDDMHKNDMIWPNVSEVYEYRKDVYKTVVNAIETHESLDDEDGNGVVVHQDHPMWALFMGFEHERIHFETSSVLFREGPLHLLQLPNHWPSLHPSAVKEEETTVTTTTTTDHSSLKPFPTNSMIPVSDTTSIDLGKPADFPSYGWDNEYGHRTMKVPPFEASKYMISNGEFREFVAEGKGYTKEEYWCEDGWGWRRHRNLKWPFFWEQSGPAGSHEYKLRTVFETIEMPWSWPVDVTYFEAKAFCKWKTQKEQQEQQEQQSTSSSEGTTTKAREYRLLTEAEHHVIRPKQHNLKAAREDANADRVMVHGGDTFGETTAENGGCNLNLAYGSHNPVDWYPPSHTGHCDTTGNAWEWTEDHFNPLEDFKVHDIYDDFSAPCFDGKHHMIVGGSFVSTGDEASVFARFHFRPHFLQHSGFRLVRSDGEMPVTQLPQRINTAHENQKPTQAATTSDNVYETDESLNMYLGLHYPYISVEREETHPEMMIPHENAPLHALQFPQRVAQLLSRLVEEQTSSTTTTTTALDMGCAVGGSSFALAQHFDSVRAFDYSHSFIDTARRIQNKSNVTQFKIPLEADIHQTVQVDPSVLYNQDGQDISDRISFFQGDATKINQLVTDGVLLDEANHDGYDGILLSNLLCRLPNPRQCLQSLPQLVKDDTGVVLLVTPYSWLEEFTSRQHWLGGAYDPVNLNEPLWSADAVRDIMSDLGFVQTHNEEIPCLIREHQRKYQYIISQATAWQKK